MTTIHINITPFPSAEMNAWGKNIATINYKND